MTVIVDLRQPLPEPVRQYVLFALGRSAAVVYVLRNGQELPDAWPQVPRQTSVIHAPTVADALATMLREVNDFLSRLPGKTRRRKAFKDARLLSTDRTAFDAAWALAVQVMPLGEAAP